MSTESEYDKHTINAFEDRLRKRSILDKKSLSLTEQLEIIELLKGDCNWFNDTTLDDKDGFMLRLLIAKRRLNP